MLASAERFEHLSGVLRVRGLAENMAVAVRHGITTENQSVLDPRGHVGCLLSGQPSDELLGRFAAASVNT